MAISGGDGSIILTTKVDETGLNKGIKGLKGGIKSMSSMFSSLGATIAAAFSIRAIKAFADESKNLYKIQMQNEVKLATVMRQRMKATDDEIKSMLELASAQQQIGIIGDEVQLAGLQQVATFATQKETIETLLPAMNNLIAQQYGYEASTESARNVANLMGKVLQGQVGALTRVGITFSEAEEQMLKTGNEMERAAVLAQVITNNVGEMNKALAKTDVGRQQQLANTFGDIKEQFGAAFTQLSILFLPALQFLANVLATIAQIARAAAQAIANMFGKEITENTQATQSSIGGSVDGMEDLADATKKAGKEAKKTTANFDELQILTSNASGGSGESETETAGGGIAGGGAIGTGFDFGIQDQVGEIEGSLALIMGIVGEALLAIGLLLLFYGQIMWGLGFIITGATVFVAAVAAASGSEATKGIVSMLTTIMGIAGGALLALGIILLWLGGVVGKGVAIGMIIAGASLIVSAVATKAAFSPNDIKGWLSTILGIASGALLALGIILCMVGSTPLGVGMIIAGSVALVSAVALNFNEVTDKITGWVAVIMAIAGGALLVLGIVLTASGANLALGIALIAVGAIALVTPIALNWNVLVDKLKGPIGLITALVGAAVLVLGIILTCTGNFALGIPLLVAGAAALVTPIAVNWDGIVDKVKEIWNKIKQFWNTYIAPIFTAQWWADLGKRALNGLIGIVETGLNYLIEKINAFIGGISKVTSAVGDVIGADWSIPKIPKVKIPRLARGAVIPPNREFLAVLGDQKNGTNIEAPAELIKQMAIEAMLEVGMTGQPTKEEHYYLGETELMSIIYRLVKGGERIKGNSLITGGMY